VYSWPAGQAGLLRGYSGDRESGEFTVFHLKEFIRTIAAIDEVEKINFSAHSRGTDVILTALRELIIEARAGLFFRYGPQEDVRSPVGPFESRQG
jgi:esterase/lipase superfamily enzyme